MIQGLVAQVCVADFREFRIFLANAVLFKPVIPDAGLLTSISNRISTQQVCLDTVYTQNQRYVKAM
jgi:hypothetical protein